MAHLPLEIRSSLLRRHGSFSQAYSATFQPELEHFGDRTGFLAYKMVGGTAMVLSDPVAPPPLHSDLLSRFLAQYGDACFCQVSRRVADVLARLGFRVNEMGLETRLDLAHYDFNGQKKRNLRKAVNQMTRLGYVTRECRLSAIDAKELEALSAAWRRTRTIRRREVAFLNRPLVFAEEPDVRRFFTFDPDGRLAAFGFFDPVYENGEVVGYSISTRQRTDVDFMVGHALKRCAIETFQREGRKWVYLGLSPVDGIEDKDFEHNWLIRRALRFAYTNSLFNRFIYPLQGHAAHKRQFDGMVEQTYFAFNALPSLPRLFKMLRACNVI
jgi:phosphatidylglycerol lysyltransferase